MKILRQKQSNAPDKVHTSITLQELEDCLLYTSYRIADNVSVLGDFYYIMKYSMFKTYAAKYKTHISNIRRKYGYKRFGIKYPSKSGKAVAYFYDEGFKRDTTFMRKSDIDYIPQIHRNLNRTSLISRLKANRCEWCGAEAVSYTHL